MKKRTRSPDNTIAYIVSVLAIIIVSVALVWAYKGFPRPGAPAESNTVIGPLDFKVQNQSARITLDLQSSVDNERWTRQHQGALEEVIDRVLADTDPALMNGPNDVKFAKIQSALLLELNKSFPEAKISNIYITDFVSSQI